MLPIEHIGIAVNDLSAAVPIFEKLLNTPCYKTEEVPSEKVRTAFFQTGQAKLELLETTDPEGVISKFLARRGEGIHHIAFEVADLEAEIARLTAEGFTVIGKGPRKGADNKLVCFLHPRSTAGVLVELCMELR